MRTYGLLRDFVYSSLMEVENGLPCKMSLVPKMRRCFPLPLPWLKKLSASWEPAVVTLASKGLDQVEVGIPEPKNVSWHPGDDDYILGGVSHPLIDLRFDCLDNLT